MIWTQDIPSMPGWYWQRHRTDKDDVPRCILVRDYAGWLAIGNSYIDGWDALKQYDWAGPIPLPREAYSAATSMLPYRPDAEPGKDNVTCTICGQPWLGDEILGLRRHVCPPAYREAYQNSAEKEEVE